MQHFVASIFRFAQAPAFKGYLEPPFSLTLPTQILQIFPSTVLSNSAYAPAIEG
jgi:hypothetical protein